MSRTLSQAVGEAVTFDLGPRGVLVGTLELRQGSEFLCYKQVDSGRVEIRRNFYAYALVPGKASFWYDFGAIGSPFDKCCTVNEKNEIIYTEPTQISQFSKDLKA